MGNNRQNRQKNKKMVWVLSLVVISAMLVLLLLQIFDIFEDAYLVSGPLSCGLLLLQVYGLWPRQRKLAIFSICCASLMLILFIVGIVLRILGM